MASTRAPKQRRKKPKSSLMVRLDSTSKKFLTKAAALRNISVSDYVRTVTVSQARNEVLAATEQVIKLTPQEQLAFWKALNEAPRLTSSQRQLGKLMRGEA